MNAGRRRRAAEILDRLAAEHPDASIALHWSTPLELLVATILSAQSTDVGVNKVTETLFRRFRTPEDYLAVPVGDLEQLIKPTGFFRQKTAAIRGCCAAILERHDGEVPRTTAELVKLLGRLKYRTSYGQNVLVHSVETSHLAAIMAAELGADINAAKIGGLLHDIGKAVDHEVEGPHAAIGATIAQKHNMPMKIVNSIAAHHQEVEFACIEAPIVQVADAISASRPGARGETMETYVKRLEDLQGIAESFAGVERSFAVQAGREVRILVRPEEIDDLSASRLARDIVKKIEDSLTYPGQIKVTVIRETRAVEYAK